MNMSLEIGGKLSQAEIDKMKRIYGIQDGAQGVITYTKEGVRTDFDGILRRKKD